MRALFNATVTPPTRRSPPRRPIAGSRSPSAGRTCGAGSSTTPRVKRRSPVRRLRESPRSTRSRRRSGAQAPTSVAACARRRANRSSWRSGPGSSISCKSGIADELRYGLNHWEGLVRFLDDGRIELDTNIVERGIRPIVLNRKNALFAGHDEGAENWACVASLIETCKLNDVEPQAYIADVLDKLVNLWPASRIDELMPWTWPKAPPAHRLAA